MKKSRQLSKFIDIESLEERQKLLRRLGISETAGLTIVPFVVCPFCCFSHPLRRSGKYRTVGTRRGDNYESFAFNLFDINSSPFISIRTAMGRKGFQEKAILRLQDIPELPEGDRAILLPLLRQLKEQCQKVLRAIDGIV